ncbi:alkaline-phosphatase-like protein [Tribonema minus]|uniref:Alkaline-phosphatase-like protein n=1 Tax=Tribonema minus TaxID=303371 RepID=A0A836CKW5_9STRA|nr:alkaline-phosphatase-like protein [Tribonema minus]
MAKGGSEDQGAPAAALNPPNIIFILADDLGWNDVGWAGDDFRGVTPYLDSLRHASVELTSYYTQQLCTPARAALLTGRYPFKTGMQAAALASKAGMQAAALASTDEWGIPLQYSLMPQYLAQAGYTSHLVGKWHVGHASAQLLPTSRGFATSYGYLTAMEHYATHLTMDSGTLDFNQGWADGLAPQEDDDSSTGQSFSCVADKDGLHSARIASHWNSSSSVPQTPLFLYMAYQNPHWPTEPDAFVDFSPIEGILSTITDSSRQDAAKLVYTLDREVERLVTGLTDAGVMDNYVLVFASDNGPCQAHGLSTYPLRGAKNYTFEGGSHVRAFVQSSLLPSTSANTSYDGLFHVTDWLPTFMEMAWPGWSQTRDALELDGVSQWEALMSAAASGDAPRTELVYNLQESTSVTDNTTTLFGAIRQGNWKYIWNEDCQLWNDLSDRYDAKLWNDFSDRYDAKVYTSQCKLQGGECTAATEATSWLFNLAQDPYEIHDLSSTHPKLIKHFQARLRVHQKALQTPLGETVTASGTDPKPTWNSLGCIGPWL